MHGRHHPAELDLGSQMVRTACNAYPRFPHALPEGEVSRRLRKALWALPVLMFTAVFSHIKRFFYKKK